MTFVAAEVARFPDPFAKARFPHGAAVGTFHGEDLLMLLTWDGVRRAARDFETFDSSYQGRVPIPPENGIRPFRQLPIETNPPEHGKWKDIVLPFFRRPTEPAAKAEFETVLRTHLNAAIENGPLDLIRDFALPVQSSSLAVLLDTRREIAAEWEGWGLHALRTDGKTDPAKSARFLDFIDRVLEAGRNDKDMGLFSALHNATIDGRALTYVEMRGICHLALAGALKWQTRSLPNLEQVVAGFGLARDAVPARINEGDSQAQISCSLAAAVIALAAASISSRLV